MSEKVLPRYTHDYQFYIASGWFNENQMNDLETIKKVLDTHEVKYFSPMDEIVCPADADAATRTKVFAGNISAIRKSRILIVNTRDKDMGTIFEAGVGYAMFKRIIYVAFGIPAGANFNLMLAASGIAVCTTITQLHEAVTNVLADDNWQQTYTGTIE